MKIKDIVNETATSGSTSAGGIASSPSGFASGGIGVLTRNGGKKKTPRKAKRINNKKSSGDNNGN